MIRFLLAVSVLALCAGCAALADAGHTAYTVSQPRGRGCEFRAADGKEYTGGRVVAFRSDPDGGCVVLVQEGDSAAFRGQAISGKALSVMPITSLPEILR